MLASSLASGVAVLMLGLGAGDARITSGAGTGQRGYAGDGGPAVKARLDQPFDLIFDPAGHLIFSDTGNHVVRRIDADTGMITTIAGNGTKGFSGDGGPATRAQLNEPYGLALDDAGNLYIADRLNLRVRRVDPAGVITTVAGTGRAEFSGDGGAAAQAGLVEPNDVVVDRARNRLLIADVAGHRVRAIDLAAGVITTAAGDGRGRHAGDGGAAAKAALHGPRALAIDSKGGLLILERNGNTLRRVDPATGVITTIAGTGRKGNTGDGGPALLATFDGPKELALDPAGAILVVDTENQTIRRIDPVAGTNETVAGNATRGGGGDGGLARQAQLDRPHGVAVGPDGSIWIGDTNNHRLRRVEP